MSNTEAATAEELSEMERLLPIANVGRIMKRALPDNAKISKESKEIIQECASEFISFITSEASDRCLQEKRKTINGEDILWSMHSLGFENYSEALKIYLAKIREAMKLERGEDEPIREQQQQQQQQQQMLHQENSLPPTDSGNPMMPGQ